MPYYYGLFFKVFGVHITSVLLGRALMVVALFCLFLFVRSLPYVARLAFLAAAWFTQSRQEFSLPIITSAALPRN